MAGRRPYKFDDPDLRSLFLARLREIGEIAPTAAAVGVSRQCVYDTLNRDESFAEACQRAIDELRASAHDTLRKIAIEGVTEKRYDKEGNLVAEITKYDTRALLRFLARHDPSWREGVQVDQKVSAEVTHKRVDPKDIPKDARNRLRDALASLPEDPSEN